MKKIRKSFGRFFAFLLLLCFTVALVPIDFYHNHSEAQPVCKEKVQTGACQHKLHLSEKTKSCWACAVHFNKSYTQPSLSEKVVSFPAIALLSENRVTSYFTELIFTALRGPPAE